MAAAIAATFTLINCVRGSLYYGDIWNLVWSVRIGETLNFKHEVRIFTRSV